MQEETIDEILGGSLRIIQSARGYRFNLDSLMLAHFASLKSRSAGIDLGCGNGIIALILARRYPNSRWVGLEIQPRLAGLAKRNVLRNALADRVDIVTGDVADVRKQFPKAAFDHVVFNPPYRKLLSGRMNPSEEKAVARHELSGSVRLFAHAATHLLRDAGRVFVVYPASRLIELLFVLRQEKIEPKRMKLVYSDHLSSATLVLVEGRLFSREEINVEAPLYIYDATGDYSQSMKAIFSDLSGLPSVAAG